MGSGPIQVQIDDATWSTSHNLRIDCQVTKFGQMAGHGLRDASLSFREHPTLSQKLRTRSFRGDIKL